MSEDQYKIVMDELGQIKQRLAIVEVARPQAESGTVACSAAVERVSLPRSADRDTLAKVEALVKDVLALEPGPFCNRSYVRGHDEACRDILQRLRRLDLGQVAERPSEDNVSMNQTKFGDWEG